MSRLDGIKCILFDADNTLYSTKSVAKEADMSAMKVLSEAVGEKPEDLSGILYLEFLAIVQNIKNSPDPKVRNRKYSYGLLCAKYEKDVLDKMYEAFEKIVIEKIELIPGIVELLETLKNKELYVITEDNRDMAIKKLTKLDLLDKFKSVITSDEAGTMKPSENYYSELISKFNPADILVIGDNYEKDLELPEKLGMKTFLVRDPNWIETFAPIIKQG